MDAIYGNPLIIRYLYIHARFIHYMYADIRWGVLCMSKIANGQSIDNYLQLSARCPFLIRFA